MIRRLLLIFNLFLFCTLVIAQTGSLAGKVTDSKTGEPLIGATVQIEETSFGAVTDAEGYYSFSEIPTKTYNIKASYVGYNSLVQYNIVIRSEGNIDVNFPLEEAAYELDELVVKPNPFTKLQETPLSIQKLSQEEVAAYPGGNNDIAKVVQSLPGVSGSVAGFRNDVIIRGGAPNENVYYLDGVEIPNINHFATQGSAGGPVGLLNVSFFEGVTLTTSAFGAQYDNVLSGVLQFDQRTGNPRKFGANIRVGASEAALTLEGPLFKGKKERGNTTFIASVRRSYLQFLFDFIGLPILPDYWDYQYKLNHKIDAYNEITFTGVGSIDDFSVSELEEFDPEQQAVQDQVPVIRQQTNALGLTWRNRFKDNSGYMQTTVSSNVLNNQFSQYSDNVNQTGLFFENDSKEQETKLRYRLTKFFGKWTTNFGGSVQFVNYRNETRDLINNLTFNSSLDFFRYGLFVQSSTRFLQERLSFSVGLRVDGNTFTDTGNELYRTLSPRMALSYRLSQDGSWNANFSVGRYFKIPPYTILGFEDNFGNNINRSSKYIRSDHIVGGIEYLINESARITLEGFVKLYDNYPVSVRDSVSVANKGGGFEVLGSEPVASVGKGRTYGAEFLFQQKFNGNFYAIVAYTLFWSEFTGFDEGRYLPSTWDNRHLVALTAGYKLKGNWEISARYRYLGRAPFVPVDEEATLANYPALIRDYSRFGEERLSAFSQLDMRVDKKWNFKKFSFDLFIDVQNVLSTNQPQEPQYGLDRTDEGLVVRPNRLIQIENVETSQVLPTIGIVINF